MITTMRVEQWKADAEGRRRLLLERDLATFALQHIRYANVVTVAAAQQPPSATIRFGIPAERAVSGPTRNQ